MQAVDRAVEDYYPLRKAGCAQSTIFPNILYYMLQVQRADPRVMGQVNMVLELFTTRGALCIGALP